MTDVISFTTKRFHHLMILKKYALTHSKNMDSIRGLSQITFALRVGRWSEKRVVYYIKSANLGRTWSKKFQKMQT